MLSLQLRDAITVAPRAKLPELAALLWRAFGEGRVSEAEAEALSTEIDARRQIAPSQTMPAKRRTGARPRTPDSLARRRRWAASGALPPQIAAGFTQAEVAVLAVVTREVAKHGRCTLTIGHIAALAGVCPTSVRNALREARASDLIQIEERRIAAWRNAPNRVSITSAEWRAWITRRGGCKSVNATSTKILNPSEKLGGKAKRKAAEGGARRRRQHPGLNGLQLAAFPKSDNLSHSNDRL